jgi:hypothetical protein
VESAFVVLDEHRWVIGTAVISCTEATAALA